MKVEIDSKYLERAAVGILLIMFAVFLDLLPGQLPVSLGALAWFALLGGIAIVGFGIASWLTRNMRYFKQF